MLKSFSYVAATLVVGLLASVSCANGIELGSDGSDFNATTPDGKEVSLDTVKAADVVVLVFTCNACPVAVAYEDRFIEFNKQYKDKNVAFVAINTSPSEDMDAMQQRIEEKGLNYTYAYDKSGDSVRAYKAKVTPHCFVLDKNRQVVYQGAFDDQMNGEPTEKYVSSVVDSVLKGEAPKYTETRPVGCGIKYNR